LFFLKLAAKMTTLSGSLFISIEARKTSTSAIWGPWNLKGMPSALNFRKSCLRAITAGSLTSRLMTRVDES